MILSTQHVKELQKKAKETFAEVLVRFNYRPNQPVVTRPAEYKTSFGKQVLHSPERSINLYACVLKDFDNDIRELDMNIDFIPKAMIIEKLNNELDMNRKKYMEYNKSARTKWQACYERCMGEGKKILIQFINDNSN